MRPDVSTADAGRAGSPSRQEPARPGVATLALLLLALLPAYFIHLGANTIWDANEAFYVDTPRQMVERGDYLTPWFNGTERLNKPVLSYWIVAALYNVAGVSVTVERVGIALGAMGLIAATFVVGRALHSTAVGLLAALIVASAPRVVMFSRRIFIDVWITAFMAITLACFVMALREPHRRRAWLLAMYAAIGLGVLTKGPIALFLPVVVAAIWMTVCGRWGEVRRLMIGPGALIVLAIVVPWYAALYVEHGWAPIVSFFVGENVGRYTGGMPSEGRGVLFYLPVLFGDLFPWAPLLAVPIARAWRTASPGEPADRADIRRLLWIWILTIVGVFSLSQSKQDLYIFPVVPAVAALVAHALLTVRTGTASRVLDGLLGVVAVLTMVAGALCYWLFGSGYYALAGVGAIAAVCVAGGAGTLATLLRGRRAAAIVVLAATFVAFDYLFVARALPSVERLKPSRPLAESILARGGAGGRVGSYHMMFPSIVYYLGRPVAELPDVEAARAFFAPDQPAWAIMGADRFAELSAAIDGVCVVERRPLFEAKASDLLSRRPPADVLLVSNVCGDDAGDSAPAGET